MLTGSLETFTSNEVLRLVAGTRKTGQLVVSGAGPMGQPIAVEITVRDGAVVTATGGTPLASDTTTSLADMLRISQGEFSFDADGDAGYGQSTVDVDEVIAAAEAVMAEWQLLETYVPTLDAVVELAATIPGPVTLQSGQWTTLSAIGTGCTARDLARLTGEGPLEVCRDIRSLVELGVVRVRAVEAEIEDETDVEAEDDSDRGDRSLVAVADLPEEDARGDEEHDAGLPLLPDAADLMSTPEVEVPAVDERFRHFSPRAAVAMTVSEPGGSHLAQSGDEAVSRNLLLKFLATARQSA